MRFTIRDLLWLTLVVGLAVGLAFGWWVEHSKGSKMASEIERMHDRAVRWTEDRQLLLEKIHAQQTEITRLRAKVASLAPATNEP